MPERDSLREDLYATLDTRRELGPEYEAALVESFVARLDETIATRVRGELEGYGHRPPAKTKSAGAVMVPIALGSLGIGIPLTGIGAGTAGFDGLLLVWVGIVVINLAAAAAIFRRP